jgi:formylglycine-generating enzyme required for sulfatase activity
MKTLLSPLAILAVFFLLSASTAKKHPLLRHDILNSYVEIPEGEVVMSTQKYRLDGFFIARYEITNRQYQEFLQSLKDTGDEKALSMAMIKNDQWQKINAAGKPEENYHVHPVFADFPVVNITYEGAQLYCQWLTEKINQEISLEYEVEVKLPSREEWIRAARGNTNNIYAWNSPYLQDAKGYFLCNFKKLGAELISFNAEKQEYELIKTYDGPDATLTEPGGNYPPNTFGLYDMCGNVAEMIAERGKAVGGNFDSPGYDVRVENIEEFEGASPLVGFRPILIIKE